MSFWANSFRRDKFLFTFFLFFIGGQILFTLKGVETFPFWNYGMYSEKMKNPQILNAYDLEINKEPFQLPKYGFPHAFMEYQLRYALPNNEKHQTFGLWLKRYLQPYCKTEIHKIVLRQRQHQSEKPYKLFRSDEYSLYQ